MLKFRHSLICLLAACIFGFLTGCGGSGNQSAELLTPATPEFEMIWPGMPVEALPLPDDPRITSETSNWLNGSDSWQVSTTGATRVGSQLQLSSTEDGIAWGIWRWGVFDAGIFPNQLRLELTSDSANQYWLLLSNYTLNKWEVKGPFLPADSNIAYLPTTSYVSASGYSYVALVVHDGNQLNVERLSIQADESVTPPNTPQDLVTSNITHVALRLKWTANTEPDLAKYNIYRGPNAGFELATPGVELIGTASLIDDMFYVTELEPETTYHFRISALNAALVESPLSETATAQTLPTPNYFPPTDVTLDQVSSGWADISWSIDHTVELDGVNVFLGPEPDFALDDPGVVKSNSFLITADGYRIPSLAAETEHYCRLQAIYLGIHQSELSETLTFSTVTSIPPVPNFTYQSTIPEQNEVITFNPSSTTDEDTALEDLTFQWDFDDDDIVDQTTLGPDTVEHTFTNRGIHPVTLIASDGVEVEVTLDLDVIWKHDSHYLLSHAGVPGKLIAMDADPVTGEIAALIKRNSTYFTKWFSGTSWYEFAIDFSAGYFWDIALSPTGITVLVADQGSSSTDWRAMQFNSGSWSEIASGSHGCDPWRGMLDCAPNGRLGVMILGRTGDGGTPPNFTYKVFVNHEEAGSTITSYGPTNLSVNSWEPIGIERSDTTTYAYYANAGSVNQWEVTDSTETATAIQSHAAKVTHLTTGQDDATPGNVFWAYATDGSRIYYGDNYGTANAGTQYYESVDASTMLGVGLLGDNEGRFFWGTGTDVDQQSIEGFDTVAGGSPTVFASGYGLCLNGQGTFFKVGGAPGVYIVTSEERDGECVGRFIEGMTESFIEGVYVPDSSTSVTLFHQVLVFDDDSILGIHTQSYPSTLASYLPSLASTPTASQMGRDCWSSPRTACITNTPGEFFTGDLNPAGHMIFTRYMLGDPIGQVEMMHPFASIAQLEYQPTTHEPFVFYTQGDGSLLNTKHWDGAAWIGEEEVPSLSPEILSIDVAMHGSEIGVAYLDEDHNVVLVEYTTSWQSPEVLSTANLNLNAGISLDYNASGDLIIAVERNDGDPGIYLGTKPAGGAVSWEKIGDTDGARSLWFHAFNHLAEPLVMYYHIESPLLNSKIRILDHESGSWTSSILPFQTHGNPVDATIDSSGNIVLAGYSSRFTVRRAFLAVIYP